MGQGEHGGRGPARSSELGLKSGRRDGKGAGGGTAVADEPGLNCYWEQTESRAAADWGRGGDACPLLRRAVSTSP